MSQTHYQPLLAQHALYLQQCAMAATPLDNWHGVAGWAVGYRHLMGAKPCQDRAVVALKVRPSLVLCDGAGSAACSEQGAEVLSLAITRLLSTLEPWLQEWLDECCVDVSQQVDRLAHLVVRHAKGILRDLAESQQRSSADYRTTLLLAVAGKHHCFWLRIGDGVLGWAEQSRFGFNWKTLGAATKGEFANQTCFVDDNLQEGHVRYGSLQGGNLLALVAMSDGAAERFCCQKTGQLSSLLNKWALESVSLRQLHECLSDGELWRRSTGDDKSLALLVAPRTQSMVDVL